MTLRSLLVANFDEIVGGGEIGLVMLADGLLARGHEPLVAIPGGGPLASHLPREEIPSTSDEAMPAIRSLAEVHDVVHVFSAPVASLAVDADLSRPIVWHVLVPNRSPLDDALSSSVDAIICNSRATARRFAAASRVHVVLNGVSAPRPTERVLDVVSGRRTIGIVGSTCARKGQVAALPALRSVIAARPDVDIAFIGRVIGPDGRLLTEVARRSQGRIRLHGFVPQVADLLSALALVVVPSGSEGFGRVAVEALRAGVPVLACPVEGLVEALDALPDPWLPVDRHEWGRRILDELDNPTDPEVLRAAAERFDPDRFVDEVMTVVQSVVGDDRP